MITGCSCSRDDPANGDAADAIADVAQTDGKVVAVAEVHVVGVGPGSAGRVVGAEIDDAGDQVARDPVAAHGNRADLRAGVVGGEIDPVVGEDGSALNSPAN